MRRDQWEHAIRTACQIIGRREVIIVGSQAILGTFREDQLPADATMSVEVDILPVADDNAETARLADLIEGVAGSPRCFASAWSTCGSSLPGWRPWTPGTEPQPTEVPPGSAPGPQARVPREAEGLLIGS